MVYKLVTVIAESLMSEGNSQRKCLLEKHLFMKVDLQIPLCHGTNKPVP